MEGFKMPKKIKLMNERLSELKEVVDTQDGSARELARAQAILMYEKGVDLDLIYEVTRLKRSSIFKWRSRFQKHGAAALREKQSKPKHLLTKNQMMEIVKVLKMQKPKAYGYRTEYWNTTILAELIKRNYNVEYKSKKRLYLLFESAKLTYHKPGQQYRNRNQEKIDAWVAENTPIIKGYLEELDTVVFVADEMVISTQTTFQKIWLPKNEFPKVDVSNKRTNRSIYGFLNVVSGVEHAFKTKYQNGVTTCAVLDKLCALYPGKKIVIIWDNASWHRSEEVRKWLSATKHNIKLIAFPTYSPELNPQEHVWKEGRSSITHNQFIDDIDRAADAFVAHLNNTIYQYKFLNLVHA